MGSSLNESVKFEINHNILYFLKDINKFIYTTMNNY